MLIVLKVFSIILFGTAGWPVVFELLYIAGLWRILGKCGIDGSWSVVPFVREYMLGKCARREKAGLVLLVLRAVLTAVNLFSIVVGDKITIVNFAVPVAALSLVIILLIAVYEIRIYRGLIEVFDAKRRWVLSWLFFRGFTSLYWGFSKKRTPVETILGEHADLSEAEVSGSWFSNLRLCLNMAFERFFFGGTWRNLPIAAAITVLVASIARNDFFQTMEGTIKGSLALTCIAIWNGCFNSILSVCEQRPALGKLREKGLHISSFIVSTLFCQAILCLAQTFLVMYACILIGIQFPSEGMFSSSLVMEIGVTIFLITYAADLMSLCVSALVKKSLNAMMIMPFLLVIQLVFSGSVINVAAWSNSISRFTISNYGVKCIAAQADYNDRPMVLGWSLIEKLEPSEVGFTITAGQVMDILQDEENYPAIKDLRSRTVGKKFTVSDVRDLALGSESVNEILDADIGLEMTISDFIDILMEKDIIPSYEELWEKEITKTFTVGQIYEILDKSGGVQEIKDKTVLFDFLTVGTVLELVSEIFGDKEITITMNIGQIAETVMENESVSNLMEKRPLEGLTLRKAIVSLKLDSVLDSYSDYEIDAVFNVGALIDSILEINEVQKLRDREISYRITIGELIDKVGEERVKNYVIGKTSASAQVPEYVHESTNVFAYWGKLLLFILVFGLISSASVWLLMKRKR